MKTAKTYATLQTSNYEANQSRNSPNEYTMNWNTNTIANTSGPENQSHHLLQQNHSQLLQKHQFPNQHSYNTINESQGEQANMSFSKHDLPPLNQSQTIVLKGQIKGGKTSIRPPYRSFKTIDTSSKLSQNVQGGKIYQGSASRRKV